MTVAVPTDHEVFARFASRARFIPNWLGVLHAKDFFSEELGSAPDYPQFRPPPATQQDYLEWIDILEAVTTAQGRFTIVELGAGIGIWSVNAVTALRAYSGIPYRVVAVEAEPTHFRWMRDHFRSNRLRRSWCRRVNAAIWETDGEADFYAGNPSGWYGQALVPVAGEGLEHDIVRVKTISPGRLLRRVKSIDLMHLDIQGAELRVLSAATEELARVKRVHVATHSTEIEVGLRNLFGLLGWSSVNDYSLQTEAQTPWGPMRFHDGVQTWTNPASADGRWS